MILRLFFLYTLLLIWSNPSVWALQQQAGTHLQVHTPTTPVALVGGTLVDVSNSGHTTHDIPDAVIVIEGDRIIAAGTRDETPIPDNARIENIAGTWVLPGLIDGFATLNNQAYADAYLAMGITGIIGVDGGRRGPMFLDANPSPHIFRLEGIGSDPMPSIASVEAAVDSIAAQGFRIALLMYGLTRDQLKAAHQRARMHGMGTVGELGYTSYQYGNEVGLDAFVHTTRYSLDAAPHYLAEGVAYEPFSNDLDSNKWQYYLWLAETDLNQPAIQTHAQHIGQGPAAIMPTASLLYLDHEVHENPWTWPVAAYLDPKDVDAPAHPETGNHTYDPAHQAAYTAVAKREIEWEQLYYKAGARYLAGSATDVWGTMPGISLHTELELLTRIGLTNREALAAATSNIAETFRLEGWGAIKAGHLANLVIVRSDPLEDIKGMRDVRLTVVGGLFIR